MNTFIDYSQSGVDKKQVVVCAAARCTYTGVMVCGVRHGDDSMLGLYDDSVSSIAEYNFEEQGFVDNKGNFLTREEAWVVAYDAGQIRYICGGQSNEREGNHLYSENLY